MRRVGNTAPPLLERWRRFPVRARPAGAVVASTAVAGFLLALSLSIWLPAATSIHSTIRMMHYNSGGVVVTGHEKGCGSYWDTRQIGHGVEARVQLAAGFCWNGKRVWWTWGLQRGNCYPMANIFTQVHMTCQITGGGHTPISVRYEADVTSAIFPFITRTETLELIVTPQGYRLQIPFQPS